MTLVIKDGNAPPVNTNIFVCIYGEPGNKKTSFAITAEEPLLLDFDQRGHRAYNSAKTKRIDVTSFDDIEEAVDKYKKQFKTIVIDTAGRAIDNKSKEIIALSKKSPNMKAHNPFGGLSLPGYGILKNAFYNAVGSIRDSGMHCVFVCHGKRTKEGEVASWEPDVAGSSSEEIYKVCDLMGLMSPSNGRTILRLNPSENWAAKNPLGLSTVFIDKKDEDGWEVTLKDLMDRCIVAVNKTNTPVAAPEIIGRIDKCESIDQANELVKEIQAMPEGVQKDMASTSFKNMRKRLGLEYTKERGVFAR